MWSIYAILASILWGLDYALVGKLFKSVNYSTVLAAEFLLGFLGMALISLWKGSIRADVLTLSQGVNIFYFFGMLVAFFVAQLFIATAITIQNATLASFLELSYPLFVAIFSWILFRENSMNIGTAFGGALLFLGALLVYLCGK